MPPLSQPLSHGAQPPLQNGGCAIGRQQTYGVLVFALAVRMIGRGHEGAEKLVLLSRPPPENFFSFDAPEKEAHFKIAVATTHTHAHKGRSTTSTPAAHPKR